MQVKGFQKGSVIWIKSEEPYKVLSLLPEDVRRMLAEDYITIITTPDVQIDELDAQTLKMYGLKKIPKPVTDPPLPSA